MTRRVLVVDDDAALCRALAGRMRTFGYVVDMAYGAAEALERSARYPYSVVVSDLLMPDIDGNELIDRLSQLNAHMAFVMMTGDTRPSLRPVEGRDARVASFLSKPFTDQELSAALDHAYALASKRQALAQQPETRRVLLIEDSATDAMLTQHVFSLLRGYVCRHVTTLRQAVQAMHDGSFDVVITDLSLPDARGVDAVVRIRECAPNAVLIACSGISDDAIAMRIVELGAHEFLAKDNVTFETLGRALAFGQVRREAARRLTRLAHYDVLTDLANRAMFEERLSLAVAQARRQRSEVALIYIDLDGFKEVNDRLGHDAGDALLKEIARRMRDGTRDYDTLARLGGDEFALVATHGQGTNVLEAAERVAAAIALPVQIGEASVSVSASLGVAVYPTHANDAATLIKRADTAMYEAKHAGKARICVARPPVAVAS